MTRSVAFAALLVLAGCAPSRTDAYERAIAEARRAVHAGHFDEAARKFDEARAKATVPRDVVYARFDAALARARAGDVARGRAELLALSRENPRDLYAAPAALKAADLALEGDPDTAYRELGDIVVAFPMSGAARSSAARIVRHLDATRPEQTLPVLASLQARLRASGHTTNPRDPGVEEQLAYEHARHLALAGRTDEAYAALIQVAETWPYPYGGYLDDALFEAGELMAARGRTGEAIALFERLLAMRETSVTLGTYERPKFAPALLRIADLQEHALHDRTKARASLHRFFEDFPSSRQRDDALYREAVLWSDDGDAETACARLATLTKTFPDSKFVPCASARCPSIARPDRSKAPRTCHAYITRPPTDP